MPALLLTRTQRQRLTRASDLLGIKPTLTQAPDFATIELQDYQRPPAGDWRTWAFKGARDTGKTLAAASYIIEDLRKEGRAARWVVGAPTDDDAILTCAEGPTGLISLFRNEFTKWNRGTGEARHYLGGYVRFMGTQKASRWHGGNWSGRWLDEVPFCNPRAIEEGDFAVRLGDHPRDIWTMTPFSISRWLKNRLDNPTVRVTRASIYDNKHASPKAVEDFERLYKNTTLGKAFLLGLDVDIPEGAIWPMLGERREHYLRPMPEVAWLDKKTGHSSQGLRILRSGAGVDWGLSFTHHSIALGGSQLPDGTVWIRWAYRGIQAGATPLIRALRGMREQGATWAAYDRSQSSLEDWIQDHRKAEDGNWIGAGMVAVKGDRNVEWRAGLVLSALLEDRLFFDVNGPGVKEAYDFLTQYQRDREGRIHEVEDDDADALCYLFAEFEHPILALPTAGIEFREEGTTERRAPDPYRFTEDPVRREPEGGLTVRTSQPAEDARAFALPLDRL